MLRCAIQRFCGNLFRKNQISPTVEFCDVWGPLSGSKKRALRFVRYPTHVVFDLVRRLSFTTTVFPSVRLYSRQTRDRFVPDRFPRLSLRYDLGRVSQTLTQKTHTKLSEKVSINTHYSMHKKRRAYVARYRRNLLARNCRFFFRHRFWNLLSSCHQIGRVSFRERDQSNYRLIYVH